MNGVSFMIWGFDFDAFDEHAMFDAFFRPWVLEGTFLVASGVLRSTLDPFGSLPVKTPPLGGVY